MLEIKITLPDGEGDMRSALDMHAEALGFHREGGRRSRGSSIEEAPDTIVASGGAVVKSRTSEVDAPSPATSVGSVVPVTPDTSEPKRRGRPPKAKTEEPTTLVDAVTPAISTGAERVGPEDDSVDVQAQDAADEAAEAASVKTEAPAPTREDIRACLGAYSTRFGTPAALADVPHIFAGVLGTPPDGGWRISNVPEGRIAEVVVVFKAAVGTNPYDRSAVS